MTRFIPALLALAFAIPSVATAQSNQTEPPQDNKPVFSPLEFDAAMKDPKKFTINSASVEIVRLQGGDIGITLPKPPSGQNDPTLPKPPVPGNPNPPFPPFPGGDGGGDPIGTIDRIVNLAKKIFDIIKENKPVVDITTAYANAVPDGISHWSQLQGWSQPATATYGFYAKNGYGVKVVDVKYQFIRQHSGNYKGKGKFLNSVTVQPLSVTVAWGYKFTMKFEAPTVANVGTSEDPVASMLARLNWAIDTVIKHEEGTSVYYLEGNGAFREIGGPFKNQAREATKEKIEKISSNLGALESRKVW